MFAATAAGLYEKVEDAMEVMGQGFDQEYNPRPENIEYYQKRYDQYKRLGGFIEQTTPE
jgi:L-ribulokinase